MLNHDAIDKQIRSAFSSANLAGLVVGIVQGGDMPFLRAYGLADAASQQPVTPQTVFRIASISKIVTAVALMRHWEEGLFQLDDPVNQHLKTFQIRPYSADSPPITIRHLLTHTSGLGELAPLISYLHPRTTFGMGRPMRPMLPLGRFYGRWLRPSAAPGSKWAYANHGFATLGQLVADLSGRPPAYDTFATHVRQGLFEPLGMNMTDFLRQPRHLPLLATGHRLKKGQHKAVWPDMEIMTQADGSLYTTAEDFGRWTAALLTQTALQPTTLDLMWQPHVQLDPRLPAMGLGFFVDQWGDQRIVSHDGAWLGFNSSLWLAPEANWGVFAFTNSGNTAVISLARELLRAIIRAPYTTDPQLPDQPEAWPALVGNYYPAPGLNSNFRVWLSHGGRLQIRAQGDQLHLASRWGVLKKGIRLRPLDSADPLAYHLNTQPILFGRNPTTGEIDRFQWRLNTFYKRQ